MPSPKSKCHLIHSLPCPYANTHPSNPLPASSIDGTLRRRNPTLRPAVLALRRIRYLLRSSRLVVARVQQSRRLRKVDIASLAGEPRLGVPSEQRHHVVHGELAGGGFALDGDVGELALAVLQVENALFDGVFDDHPVDFDVDGLVEAVDAVDCLLFDELVKMLVSAR